MHKHLDTKVLVPMPKGVLNKLDAKTRKKVEDAIKSHTEYGFVRFDPSLNIPHDHGRGQTMTKDGMLVELDANDFEVIHGMIRMLIESKADKAFALEAKKAVKELAEVKKSVKLLKGFIDE